MSYDNTNTGALFPNDRKTTDKHPDFKGQININGVEYWLSGWKKVSQAGKPFLSLSLEPKQKAQHPAPQPQGAGVGHQAPQTPPAHLAAPPPASEDEYGADPFGGFR